MAKCETGQCVVLVGEHVIELFERVEQLKLQVGIDVSLGVDLRRDDRRVRGVCSCEQLLDGLGVRLGAQVEPE